MTADTTDSEIVALRKFAKATAEARRESFTTAHLLVAIASRPGPATDLLNERKLDVDTLMRLARATSEENQDALGKVIRSATEIARASGAREAASIHLLLALMRDLKSGAHRALTQSGVDTARLRAAVTRVVNGLVEPRRVVGKGTRMAVAKAGKQADTVFPTVQKPEVPTPAQSIGQSAHTKTPQSSGVIVSLFPPRSTQPLLSASAKSAVGSSASVETQMLQSQAESADVPATLGLVDSTMRSSVSPPVLTSPTLAGRIAHKEFAGRSPRQPSRNRMNNGSSGSASGVVCVAPGVSMSTDSRCQLDPRVFPTLSSIARNLTAEALSDRSHSQTEPVVGRAVEMEQALDVLAKRRANNPMLVGPSGVGKTSIARGLARYIVANCPLDERILLEVPVASLLAGTAARGSLAERVAGICAEVLSGNRKVVLVIDEVTQLFAADGGEASTEMKLVLSKGELPLIATCRVDEYRRFADAEPAIAKCFTVVEIEEPSIQKAVEMLQSAAPELEQHHGLPIDPSAIQMAVSWSVRYLPGRALPEKALSILDLAWARARRRGFSILGAEVVAEVVSEMASVPLERLTQTDKERMLALEQLLSDQVVGHSESLARIATILRRNAAGLRSHRPIGSFLLLGPTGVGKTETAKAIAMALFHGCDAMTRLDMSEFAESHALARLIGAPPGYMGHEAGGQLTEAVRLRPYQVLLLDEFEKAHRDVQQAFLQVFDEGRMTDGRGRTVDFSNTVIVMTSNIGAVEAREAAESRTIGFGFQTERVKASVKNAVVSAAKSALPPELYNRIDEVLFFEPLSRDHVREVAKRQLCALSKRLAEVHRIVLEWSEESIDALLDHGGYDPTMGARPVKRAIARLVEAPLAELLLRETARAGDTLRVAVVEGNVRLTRLDLSNTQQFVQLDA